MYSLPIWLIKVLAAVEVWDLIWKGFALWRAGRNRQPYWFFFLLIVNSVGLLPIIYLLLFPLRTEEEKNEKRNHKKQLSS